MRIGIVLSKTPEYSETFFKNKIKGLRENGFQVVLLVQRSDGSFSDCEVKSAFGFNKRSPWVLFYIVKVMFKCLLNFNRVVRFIRLQQQDGISLQNAIKNLISSSHIIGENVDWLHFGFATLALGREQLAKSMGAKMAVSLRGFDIAIYPIKNPRCYDVLWKYVDKLHVISEDLLALANKSGLPNKTPIAKITPAIDINKFRTNGPKSTLENPVLKIVTVARLHWKKGLIHTLEALAILKERGYNFKYTLIGNGPQFAEITYAVYQFNLEKEVDIAGRKTQDEIIGYLKEANMYIQYSISEGFCNALIEAQAMGLLCVASNAEGLTENVLNEKTGWIVEKNNPKMLADKIQEICRVSEVERNRISHNAKEHVNKNFNLEQQQQAFNKFYNI